MNSAHNKFLAYFMTGLLAFTLVALYVMDQYKDIKIKAIKEHAQEQIELEKQQQMIILRKMYPVNPTT